jgi:hypothetical protein
MVFYISSHIIEIASRLLKLQGTSSYTKIVLFWTKQFAKNDKLFPNCIVDKEVTGKYY